MLSELETLGTFAAIGLPALGELAAPINILINLALASFLIYILFTARKGR